MTDMAQHARQGAELHLIERPIARDIEAGEQWKVA